jgi:hypothetical protein
MRETSRGDIHTDKLVVRQVGPVRTASQSDRQSITPRIHVAGRVRSSPAFIHCHWAQKLLGPHVIEVIGRTRSCMVGVPILNWI